MNERNRNDGTAGCHLFTREWAAGARGDGQRVSRPGNRIKCVLSLSVSRRRSMNQTLRSGGTRIPGVKRKDHIIVPLRVGTPASAGQYGGGRRATIDEWIDIATCNAFLEITSSSAGWANITGIGQNSRR